MTNRKDLAKAVANLEAKKPVTTAAVRKSAQAANREAALAHPLAVDHVEWLMKVARGETEAPSAVQTLALRSVNELLLGTEESPNKRTHDKITISITSVGGEPTGVTIDGSTGEAEEDDE